MYGTGKKSPVNQFDMYAFGFSFKNVSRVVFHNRHQVKISMMFILRNIYKTLSLSQVAQRGRGNLGQV